MAKKIASLQVDVGANVVRMQKDLAKMSGHINRWSKKSSKSFAQTWQGMAVGIASVIHIAGKLERAFAKPIKKAAEFETALVDMRKVTSRSLPLIEKEILKMPAALGTSIDLMKGYYQVISAGVTEPVKAIELLTTASKTAKAAHVGQSEVIKALTKVMSGYGGEIKTTSEAADLLFAIEKEGQTTVSELVPIMGDLAAISHEVGVKSNEMAGALALMTQTSGSTSEAATKYKAILVAMVKPNEKLTEVIKGLGYESGKAMIADLGFAESIKKIKEHSEKTGIPLGKLVRSAEGLIGIAALGAKNFENLNDKIDAMGQKTGSGAKAWDDYKETSQSAWETLTASVEKAAIVIGKKLTPATSAWARALSEVAEYWTKIIGEPKTRDYAGEILESYQKRARELKEELLRLEKIGVFRWSLGDLPAGFERTRDHARELTIELAKIEAKIAFLTQPKKQEILSITKPELPLLEDITPIISTPEFAGEYWLNLKKYSETFLNEETERMNQRIAFERETDAMLLEAKAQYYLDDKALAEERLKDYIEKSNKEIAIEKAKEELKRREAFQTHMEMISYQKEAFAELAKGSELAFALYKAFSVAETIMKTYEAAQKSYAWASTWGGPGAGAAAAAIAVAAGMARVAAIKSLEPASLYHTGGVVGESSGPTRMMPSAMFSNAPRLHGGLAADEYPAILQQGETVIPADEEFMDEDVPVLQVNLNLDGRKLTKAIIHRVEMDSVQLNRLRKAIA